jgi:hypothetical protein
MKFTYRQYQGATSPSVPSGILHRPEARLRVTGPAGAFSAWALVDTGSDDTLLPLSVGRLVGAALDPTQSWTIEGIGGHALPVILGEVTLELVGSNHTFRWLAKVGFIDFPDPQDEVFVLGHAGCLDFFRVICDGSRREVEIEITPAFPGQVI